MLAARQRHSAASQPCSSGITAVVPHWFHMQLLYLVSEPAHLHLPVCVWLAWGYGMQGWPSAAVAADSPSVPMAFCAAAVGAAAGASRRRSDFPAPGRGRVCGCQSKGQVSSTGVLHAITSEWSRRGGGEGRAGQGRRRSSTHTGQSEGQGCSYACGTEVQALGAGLMALDFAAIVICTRFPWNSNGQQSVSAAPRFCCLVLCALCAACVPG